ncbi:MAG TPA: serine hydrolase [Pseudolabrys sp.]|nr:serine hydrolase [Pseudolabrys sp.]
MSLRGAFFQRGLRWGALSLAVLLLATAASSDADARSRRHKRHRAATHAAERYEPPYASIVVDANSGKVLQASNPDAPRHPASLTKIMTLYLLFERLESGKLKLSSELPVSAHAAAQAPTKLGLKPGDEIRVENAIRAIVTKSANDVAVILAEAIGGDETSFGQMMTAKAHALGMMHTFYHNASGLPDDRQITTARDQSILARAMYDRFPQYFHYFSTRSFEFRGRIVRGHNRLLGRVAGLDGMKTGYINASGFNIVTTVHRGGRSLVAIVFGGRTASARDARVESLIDSKINLASIKRTAPPVKEGVEVADATPRAALAKEAKPVAPRDVAARFDEPAPGSTAPIRPNPVKTVIVHPGSAQSAALSAEPPASGTLTPATAPAAPVTTVAIVKGEVPPLPPLPPPGARPGVLGVLPVEAVRTAATGKAPVKVAEAEPAATEKPETKSHNGWMIQVGAFDSEKEAKQRLSTSRGKAKSQLAKAESFTERTAKGPKRLFRARFAGLGKDQAEAACKHLKRADIPCMVLKD